MKLVKTFDTAKGIYMLTELITGGELHAAIRQIPTVLNRTQAVFYVGNLLIVLEELADRLIVYRDLKPENVMLDQQGYLKLIDFGIAKKLEESKNRTFTMIGTPHYMAPEVMRGQGYGTQVDVWSLGVMLFEFVCGYLPFADDLDDPSEVCHAVLKSALAFPHRYKDASGRTLMQGMLCRQPKKRLGAQSFDEIRKDKYFQDGGATSVFDRIMARELAPPLVPKGETYCSQEEARGVALSDRDLLG
jgi:cGMP-dependent protein kinase